MKRFLKYGIYIFTIVLIFSFKTVEYSFEIAKLKYNGGGDWYSNKTSLPNLIKFCNRELKLNVNPKEAVVKFSDITTLFLRQAWLIQVFIVIFHSLFTIIVFFSFRKDCWHPVFARGW